MAVLDGAGLEAELEGAGMSVAEGGDSDLSDDDLDPALSALGEDADVLGDPDMSDLGTDGFAPAED